MDYQKIMLLVCGLLVALALYFALTAPAPPAPKSTDEAEKLLLRAMDFGKGAKDYTYSYDEISDGYRNTYTLVRAGNLSYAELQNPLSLKRVYLMDNDTILCLNYSGENTCGSVARLSDLDNYINFFRSRFLRDDLIDKNGNDLEYLLENRYLSLSPDVVQSSSAGRDCGLVTYTLDFTNLSLNEAARFGIGSNSPRFFSWSMCIDNQSGVPYEKSFNYTFNGTLHTYRYLLKTFTPAPAQVQVPSNITLGQTNGILPKLYHEREQQIKLAFCFTNMQGEDRDRCIANIALDIERKDLCELAGGRRDRCLVSLVPVTKDATICPAVKDPSFRDDCYIELAGAYKDESYCASVLDSAKKQACLDAAKPPEPAPEEPEPPAPEPTPPQNETGNSTFVPEGGNATNSSG